MIPEHRNEPSIPESWLRDHGIEYGRHTQDIRECDGEVVDVGIESQPEANFARGLLTVLGCVVVVCVVVIVWLWIIPQLVRH